MKVTINDGTVKEVKDVLLNNGCLSLITVDGCCYDANNVTVNEFKTTDKIWIKRQINE